MSRKTRNRIELIADWEISDAEVNGWFWPEKLAERKRNKGRAPINRLKALKHAMQPIIKFNDGLPF
jgi:hypothetical protein